MRSGKMIDIFVSSPSDVKAEREAIVQVIELLNQQPQINEKYRLYPQLYEREVATEIGDYPQLIVDRYMKAQDSYLVICVLWSRIGTSFTHPDTKKRYESGTVYEFESGYNANQESGKPLILLYRKNIENPDADPEQSQKVDDFFEKFHGDTAEYKGLYGEFSNIDELKEKLIAHISKVLDKYPPDTDEQLLDDIVTESRRFDAAMPANTTVNKPTDVWTQICLPDSLGFREDLPEYTSNRDLITVDDVEESTLQLPYTINPMTGKPQTTRLIVEIEAPDFEIKNPVQNVLLFHGRDSGMVSFFITPKTARSTSKIRLMLKQQNPDYDVLLGTVMLSTQIEQNGLGGALHKVWNIAEMFIGRPTDTKGQEIPQGKVDQSSKGFSRKISFFSLESEGQNALVTKLVKLGEANNVLVEMPKIVVDKSNDRISIELPQHQSVEAPSYQDYIANIRNQQNVASVLTIKGNEGITPEVMARLSVAHKLDLPLAVLLDTTELEDPELIELIELETRDYINNLSFNRNIAIIKGATQPILDSTSFDMNNPIYKPVRELFSAVDNWSNTDNLKYDNPDTIIGNFDNIRNMT